MQADLAPFNIPVTAEEKLFRGMMLPSPTHKIPMWDFVVFSCNVTEYEEFQWGVNTFARHVSWKVIATLAVYFILHCIKALLTPCTFTNFQEIKKTEELDIQLKVFNENKDEDAIELSHRLDDIRAEMEYPSVFCVAT